MNPLINLLNLNIPIIQAPMAGVQGSQLAIAVSSAGAMGSLPCAMLTLEQLHQELITIEHESKNPINLNFFCHKKTQLDDSEQVIWYQKLQPFFDEYKIDTHHINLETNRQPFSQAHVDVLAEFKPKVISFHFGLPEPHLIEQLKSWGASILSSATTLEEALYLQNHQVDIIIAQGLEAGGHRGMFLTEDLTTQVSTLALVPQIVEAVTVPVIAAGGIANAQGIKAAMALGASGVQIGTSYLLCPETNTSLLHRQALLSDEAKHTAITNIFTGRPARGIVNKAMRQLGFINSFTPSFPYATPAMSALRKEAEAKGKNDFTPLWAGQNTSGCTLIPAAELTKLLAKAL